MLLYLSAKFLNAHADQLGTCASVSDDKVQKVEELKRALRVLQGGNNLAVSYLNLLESDSFHKLCNLSSSQAFDIAGVAGHDEPAFLFDIPNTF